MLTQPQLDRFRNEGYLVIENLIDETTLNAVRAEYAAKMETLYSQWHRQGLVPEAGPGFWAKLDACYKAGFDWYQPFDISLPHHDIRADTPMHFGPAVFHMATHGRLLDMVECLIGPEITSNPIQHVRIKPPQDEVPSSETRAHIVSTDWHQDMGVTMPEADNTTMITVWLAITDATVENGCLQVAPGRQSSLLPHCTWTQPGIAKEYRPQDNAVPVPVKAGGAVVFHPFTPHASLANRSNGYRWSFDLRYNITGQPTGRSQFPDFVARSRAHPETELHDWRIWRAMWEEARATLAISPPVPQHRWSNDAPYCA